MISLFHIEKRIFLIFTVTVPIVALIILLGWALAKSDTKLEGVLVNTTSKETNQQNVPARDFTLALYDGQELRLSDLRPDVVVVDFWASWCPPCHEEALGLVQVYKEYVDRGVMFVGISIWDSESEAKNYIQQYGVTYPNGTDLNGLIAIDYGVRGIPEKVFIDKDGIVMKNVSGPMSVSDLKGVLDELLSR